MQPVEARSAKKAAVEGTGSGREPLQAAVTVAEVHAAAFLPRSKPAEHGERFLINPSLVYPITKFVPHRVQAAADPVQVRCIASLDAARGIDPYASRPSIADLMARTDSVSEIVGDGADAVAEWLQVGLRDSIDAAVVIPDVASAAAGIASDHGPGLTPNERPGASSGKLRRRDLQH